MGDGGRRALELLLVDDHAVVRAGYRRLLESVPDIHIAAEAADGETGYRRYTERSFDVVIMDLSLPGISGFETCRRILQRDRDAKILVFSIHDEPSFVQRAFDVGVSGYITKSSAPEVLVEAVVSVARGERYLGADIRKGWESFRANRSGGLLNRLTPREFEIFKLLVDGNSVMDIARMLSLSAKTVANYNTQIKNKLKVTNAAELVRFAVRHGVVTD